MKLELCREDAPRKWNCCDVRNQRRMLPRCWGRGRSLESDRVFNSLQSKICFTGVLMKRIIARSVGLGGVLLAAMGVSFAGGADGNGKAAGTPLPMDWSHRHVIFSRPATAERAAQVRRDFRYSLQQQRENVRTIAKETWGQSRLERFRRRQRRIPKLHPDW